MICDNRGYPFYAKRIDENFIDIDPILLSGLISAIGTLGKTLFKEEIATISFGTTKDMSNLVTVSKELFGQTRKIYFVFINKGEIKHNLIMQLVTAIFIETKPVLKDTSNIRQDIQDKIDRIIDNKLSELLSD